jgi:hypothetical protein
MSDIIDINKNVWDEFLITNNDQSTVFHTQEWMKTLQEAHGYEPKYFATINEDGLLIAAIPFMIDTRYGIKNYLSMPYDTYGGVIGDYDYIKPMVNDFLNLSGVGVKYIVDYSSCLDYDTGFLKSTEIMDLTNDNIWDNIHKANRTAIKYAEKHNVVVREVKEPITIFDKVPQVLVNSIVQNMVSTGLSKIYIAENEGKTVAASIFFFYNNMVMYWANTTTELGRKTNANYLILWNVIKYAKDNGYKIVNFGASPPKADSLLKFKRSWGTKTYTYVKLQKTPVILYPLLKIKGVVG